MTSVPICCFRLGLASLWALAISGPMAQAAGPVTTQTIVMMRHGEKPDAGLGQLNCQGLNRALALPAVITRLFERPAAIFAPDPAKAKMDGGQSYNYIRPLATIEPTAISLGLPIDATIGFSDIAALQQRLEAPALHDAVVLVAWEHTEIVALARELLSRNGGKPDAVPNWKGSDFDSIYVVKVTHADDQVTATFAQSEEGLNNQPTKCPG